MSWIIFLVLGLVWGLLFAENRRIENHTPVDVQIEQHKKAMDEYDRQRGYWRDDAGILRGPGEHEPAERRKESGK